MNSISVPIDAELIGELFLRVGPKADVSAYIEGVFRDYLERTADDQWSDAYYAHRQEQLNVKDFVSEFGDPKGGYHWAPLFLPNGTLVRMVYQKETFNAAVKNNKIEFDGQSLSPSEMARRVAKGTNRNAWRDLLIKRPGDTDWQLADELRRRIGR